MEAGHLPLDEQIERLKATLKQNKTLVTVLNRAASMNLPGWYLAAGSLTQTVWNVVTGNDPERGIHDYDLIYFDGSDLSWEAEDAVIKAGAQLFADIPVEVEIRNQARVHLWYEKKFGVPCPKPESSEAAIDVWGTNSALIAVRLLPDDQWKFYAPWGLSDIFKLTVRPNPVIMTRAAYENKVARWRGLWPALTVVPWPESTPKLNDGEEAMDV